MHDDNSCSEVGVASKGLTERHFILHMQKFYTEMEWHS